MKQIIVLPQFLRKKSTIFKYFPQFDKVIYCGLHQNNAMSFSASEGPREEKLFMMSFIRQSEADLWGACQGLFRDIFTSIEPGLHGVFNFELLSMEMSQKLDAFQWKEFAKGMTDLSREIPVGETRFVQYCSILGLLTKHADEDFGRISFRPQVRILYNEAKDMVTDMDVLIKECRPDVTFTGSSRLILYDLSRAPLYDSQNAEQCAQLQKMNRKLDANSFLSLKEVVIIDKNGLHDVFKRSQLELDLFGA